MELILTFFSGISLAFAPISFFVYWKSQNQKFYIYFGFFSLFSGFYFLLSAIAIHEVINLRWAILLCAATYYAFFPWFILDFIGKKLNGIAWPISAIFALAITVFIFNPDPDNYALWQVLAHLGLIGILGVTYYVAKLLIINKREGRVEFLVLTVVFILLGLEEIISNYSGQKFIGQYITGIMPLDIYPLLFTLVFGLRVANEVFTKDMLRLQLMESSLNKENLKLENLEKERLKEKLYYKSKDLTDFGIEISRKKEFTEQIYKKLSILKEQNGNRVTALNEVILFTKSHLQIDKELNLFQTNIDSVNHEFTTWLRSDFPSLTNNDVQLASLLRLKLSTKEIAVIKNISPDSVKVLRYRLRKKLNIPARANLSQFFQDIN